MRKFFFPPAPRRAARRKPFAGLEQLEDRSTPAIFTGVTGLLGNAANNGSIAAGDLDNDGYTDFVVSNYGNSKAVSGSGTDAPGNTIGVVFGTGSGVSTTAVLYPTGHSDDFVSFVAIADLNGDGFRDIVSVESQSEVAGSSGFVTVFLNSGIGTFPAAKTTQFFSNGQNASWVGVADFTGDGVPDLAVTNLGVGTSGGNMSVYQQNNVGGKGDGSFFLLNQNALTNTENGPLEYLPTAGTIADFNGDGKLDIATTVVSADLNSTVSQTTGKVAIFLNDGPGSFTANTAAPLSGGIAPVSVVSGDMNGDGKADLVIANAGDPDNANGYLNFGQGTNVSVLLGDGSGGFGNAKVTTTSLNSAFAVALSDLDLDGDLDIGVADLGKPGFLGVFNPQPGALVVYRNAGNASFALDKAYTDTDAGNQYLAIADIDGNSTPDVVVVGLHNRIARYTNSTRTSVTVLDSSTTNATAGTNITFTATTSLGAGFTGQPDGNVDFYDGTAKIGSGTLTLDTGAMKATFSTTSLAAGVHNITAKYTGSYASSPFAGVSSSTATMVTITGTTNTPPTISDITDKSVAAGQISGPHSFTIGDAETPAGSLTVSAKSSNTGLIPVSAITFSGSGASRTVSIQSTAATSGTSTITVTVTDGGGLTASDTFVLTVTSGNTAPTISDIADQSTTTGTLAGPINFTVGDAETAPGSLLVSATSSNTTLVPNGNIFFGGSGANRTLLISPAAGQNGTTTITVTVSDGTLTAMDTFVLTVSPPNTPPTISDIGDQSTTPGTLVGPLSFTIGDGETAPGLLQVSATSSNTTLVPNGNIFFGGSGANRSVILSPAAGQSGTTTITITVSDGSLTAMDTFVLTVAAPAVSAITSTSSNGTYSTGQSINVTLNFTEPLTLTGGNLLVTLDTGATVSIAPFSGTSASGTYVVAAGQTSPDLNATNLALSGGATLKNGGGVDASLMLPSSNLAVNKDILVNPAAPNTVSFITINQGAAQRSRLTTIDVTFQNPVDAASFQSLGAITLTRTQGGPAVVVQTGVAPGSQVGRINVSPASGMVSVLTLTFDTNGFASAPGVEFGSLADGRWQLAIPSAGYTSALNDANLRRLFGDVNGDGTVDGPNDFAAFGTVFGTTAFGSPFDFNNDGTIDGSNDFAQFGARFGQTN